MGERPKSCVAAARIELSATKPATVLVVEDDKIVAEIYRLTLARAGFDVAVANNGEDGLEQATHLIPDLILLDIRMPKLDGLEVLKRLVAQEATRRIPVVMLSNFDDHSLIESSLAHGAKQYLVKVNTDPTELPAVVRRWMNATG